MGPVICIGIFSGDFGFQQVQGQLAPLEGHPAHPLLQKASPHCCSAAEPPKKAPFPHHPPGAQGTDFTADSPSGPTKIPPFPKHHPQSRSRCSCPAAGIPGGSAGTHLGGVVVEQPLALARPEAEAAVEVPQPWHILQGQGQVAVAVDAD